MREKNKQDYKNWIVEVFDRTSSEYGQVGPRFFDYFASKLVERANLRKGASVLDVACGRGANLMAAYDVVGPGGAAIGIDLSTAMVTNTRKELAAKGLDAVQVRQMDAEDLQFLAESFDFVLCGFALFFFPHVDKALAEILRVVKPGGVFCTTTFGEEDQRWAALDEIIETYKDRLKPIPTTKRTPFDKKEAITESLAHAGFEKIEIFSEDKVFYFRNVETWWASLWTHGMRGLLERMDEETLKEFKEDCFEFAQALAEENGVPLLYRVFITRASRPLSAL